MRESSDNFLPLCIKNATTLVLEVESIITGKLLVSIHLDVGSILGSPTHLIDSRIIIHVLNMFMQS